MAVHRKFAIKPADLRAELFQAKVPNDSAGPEVDHFLETIRDSVVFEVAGIKGADPDAYGFGASNRVAQLDFTFSSESGRNHIFCGITGDICAHAVDPHRILATECCATGTGEAAIRIDSCLASGKSGMLGRAAFAHAAWVNVHDRALVRFGFLLLEHRLNDVGDQIIAQTV